MHWTKSKTPCVWSGIWIRLGIGWLWLKEAANSAQQVAAPTMPGWHAEVCGWLWDRRCNFDMSKLFFTHVFTTFWTVKWCNQYATLQVSLQFFTILLWLSPFWCILYPVILHILVISCHLRRETSPRKIVCHATPFVVVECCGKRYQTDTKEAKAMFVSWNEAPTPANKLPTFLP